MARKKGSVSKNKKQKQKTPITQHEKTVQVSNPEVPHQEYHQQPSHIHQDYEDKVEQSEQSPYDDEDIDKYFDSQFNQNKISKKKQLETLKNIQTTFSAVCFLKNQNSQKNFVVKEMPNQGINLDKHEFSYENGFNPGDQSQSSVIVQSDQESVAIEEDEDADEGLSCNMKSPIVQLKQVQFIPSQMKLYDQDSIQKKRKDLMQELVDNQKAFHSCSYHNKDEEFQQIAQPGQPRMIYPKYDLKKPQINAKRTIAKKRKQLQNLKEQNPTQQLLHPKITQKTITRSASSIDKSIKNQAEIEKKLKKSPKLKFSAGKKDDKMENQEKLSQISRKIINEEQGNEVIKKQKKVLKESQQQKKNLLIGDPQVKLQYIQTQHQNEYTQALRLHKKSQKHFSNSNSNYNSNLDIIQNCYGNKKICSKLKQKQIQYQNNPSIDYYEHIKFSSNLQTNLKLVSSIKNSMRIVMNYHRVNTKNSQLLDYQHKVHQVLKQQISKLQEALVQKQQKTQQDIQKQNEKSMKFQVNISINQRKPQPSNKIQRSLKKI